MIFVKGLNPIFDGAFLGELGALGGKKGLD
jgi:hypothetical protein